MKKRKRGMSLIVLIITIIVVIILAAAVILTISKNNPVTSAKEATFKSDIRTFQEDLTMYISKDILKDYYGNRNKITTSDEPNFDEMKEYISSFTKKYVGKLGIEKDKLVYFKEKVTEQEEKWLDDLGIKLAEYVIAEAHEECFEWDESKTGIIGVNQDKLNLYLEQNNGVLKIPKKCEIIGYRAFMNNSVIEDVIIQDGLKKIYDQAFRYCSNLKSIYISKSVKTISDEYVFGGCSNLIKIEVDEENENYSSQDGVLYDKNKTRLITAPGAIEVCKIPDTVKTISAYSFSECKKLKEVEMPEGVIDIAMYAFERCNSLTGVEFPSTLTKIGDHAFISTNLSGTVIIPDNVIYIGTSAFNNCLNMTKIVIGNKVETINGEYYGDRMDTHAFIFCSSLTEFEVKEGNNNFSSKDGILYNKDKTNLILAPYGIKLDGISIPNSVQKIGEYAFFTCKNITGSLYIPEGVKTIGKQSFSGIKISGSVNIPSSVTSFESTAFLGCEEITEINVDVNNQTYSSQDGVLYSKDKSILITAPQGLKVNNLVLPEQVKTIQNSAFSNCIGLSGTLTLNEGLEIIGAQSFEKCSDLSGKLVIPSTVKEIKYSAFLRTGFEGEVVIPSSVEKIEHQIFYDCLGLTKINCQHSSKPDGWASGWNYRCKADVVWGYIGE